MIDMSIYIAHIPTALVESEKGFFTFSSFVVIVYSSLKSKKKGKVCHGKENTLNYETLFSVPSRVCTAVVPSRVCTAVVPLSGMHCCCTSLGYALLLSFQAIAGIETPPPISEENLDSRIRWE